MNPSYDKIIIKGLELFGYHGYHPEERERGQLFSVDLELEGEFSSKSDALQETVDYGQVIRRVSKINEVSRFHLLESFAVAIAEAILQEFPKVRLVKTRVKKLNPPLPIGLSLDWVAAEVIRKEE